MSKPSKLGPPGWDRSESEYELHLCKLAVQATAKEYNNPKGSYEAGQAHLRRAGHHLLVAARAIENEHAVESLPPETEAMIGKSMGIDSF